MTSFDPTTYKPRFIATMFCQKNAKLFNYNNKNDLLKCIPPIQKSLEEQLKKYNEINNNNNNNNNNNET